ncbi:hypothetical protein D1953_17290 [Peribacillus asahii]|uniref:AP2-like integrase N-terminal domain-containing protein n=1 Tax=Peribacillus asahii TaxID=228899 RepID=A0A398B0Q5_9BACI|nr:Arm DNA-binding domain-containing protein [Peribacillus asahii]RID82884.1 hypothetical protein D1953_17290 [Peribacillus asahii]
MKEKKTKTKSGFKTKKEATAAMNEIIYELNKGTYVKPQNIIFITITNELRRN